MSMPEVLIAGANHRSSTMGLRDRLQIGAAAMPAFLESLRGAGLDAALVISTPERIEVIAVADDAGAAAAQAAKLLAGQGDAAPDHAGDAIYALTGAKAVRHLFAAAAALDDVVIGEPRLRAALAEAAKRAEEHGMMGAPLRALVAAADAAAEAAARAAEFAEHPATISAAAIRVARDLHGDPARCAGLLIGAGELGAEVARALLDDGLANLTVVQADEARAEALASTLDCHVARLDEIPRLLVKSEIVITAAGTRRYTVDLDMAQAAIAERRHRPVLFIDTGVPGDVDPAIETLDDAFRYTLDDLERVARKGRAERAAKSERGWAVVEAAVADYLGRAPEAGEAEAGPETPTQAARREALAEAETDAKRAARVRKSLLQRLLGGGGDA